MGGFTARDFELILVEREQNEWRAAHEPRIWPIDMASLYRTSESSEIAAKQSALISKLSMLDTEIKELSAHIVACEIEELEEKHESAYQRCRTEKDMLESLQSDIARVENILRNNKSRLNRERAQLREVIGSEPSASSYPTKSEIKAWKAKVGRQEEAVADAQAGVDADVADYDVLLATKDTHVKAFATARDEEALLRNRLNHLSGKAQTSKRSYSNVGLQS
jgi:chromosome segregation ATPase